MAPKKGVGDTLHALSYGMTNAIGSGQWVLETGNLREAAAEVQQQPQVRERTTQQNGMLRYTASGIVQNSPDVRSSRCCRCSLGLTVVQFHFGAASCAAKHRAQVIALCCSFTEAGYDK